MKGFLIFIFSTFVSLMAYSQWDVVHYGGELSNKDLFFLNPDTGFVIGLYAIDGAEVHSYVLRTQDGGQTWDSLHFANHEFSTIHFPSADTGYIATFYLPNYPSFDVLRTVDGGDSWQHLAITIGQASGVPYAISFFNNDTGIITLQGYAAITINAGMDWVILDNFPGSRDSDISSPYFIGLDGAGIGYSLDYGSTFNIVQLDFDGSHYNADMYDHRFISSAIGMHGTSIGFPTYNFGIITIGNILTNDYNISYFPELIRTKGVCWASENVMYMIGNSIYSSTDPKFFIKSVDGGATWFTQSTTETGYWGTDKIDCPNDSVCYAIGHLDGRIYKTTNGGGPLLDEVTQIVLSVKEIEDDLNFSIAPNPTSGEVLVNSEKEKIKEVKVFDLQGKELFKTYPNDFNARIDLSKFANGIYLIQIMAGDKIRTGKIVRE